MNVIIYYRSKPDCEPAVSEQALVNLRAAVAPWIAERTPQIIGRGKPLWSSSAATNGPF